VYSISPFVDAEFIFAVTLALRTFSGLTPGVDEIKKFVTRARSRSSPVAVVVVVVVVVVVPAVGVEPASLLASTAGASIGELVTSPHPAEIMIAANPANARSPKDALLPAKCFLSWDLKNMRPPFEL
jgi:hypothetical protein